MCEEAFARAVVDLIPAVDEAFRKPRLLPAFILLYSSIDILASLTRPISQESTCGPVFKGWVKTYMIADSHVLWNESDVWGARCGLLHTFTVQSDLSRDRKVRELHYINTKDREFVAYAQREIDPQAENKVIICLPDLLRSFFDGVELFAQKVKSSPELQQVVYHHSAKLVIHDQARLRSS